MHSTKARGLPLVGAASLIMSVFCVEELLSGRKPVMSASLYHFGSMRMPMASTGASAMRSVHSPLARPILHVGADVAVVRNVEGLGELARELAADAGGGRCVGLVSGSLGGRERGRVRGERVVPVVDVG